MGNELYDDFDEHDDETPDYYYCSCCYHSQLKPGMGNSCNHCGLFNVMEPEYF